MKFKILIGSALIFIFGTFILVVSLGNKPLVKKTIPPPSLVSYQNTTSSVAFTTFGNLVSNSNRIAVRITVSSSNVNISILSGYQQTVAKTEDFSNNQVAYNYFLNNLNSNNFLVTKTTKLSESSACPGGETYQLDLYDNSKPIYESWDDNCKPGIDGTFKGNGLQNISAINTLFQNQINNYSDFTSGYSF